MQVFVLFGLVIVAMGSLGEQFIGIDQAGLSGEYIGASGANMLGDTAAVVGGPAAIAAWQQQQREFNSQHEARMAQHEARMAQIALLKEEQAGAWNAYCAVDESAADAKELWSNHVSTMARTETEIGKISKFHGQEPPVKGPEPGLRVSPILIALAVVEGLEQLAGWGPPSEGDGLTAASGQFAELGAVFGSAIAGAGWQGAASRGYTGRKAGLQGVAQTIADLDAKLAGIVKAQADTVTHVRLGFGILKSLLMLAYFYELQTDLAAFGPVYAALPAKAAQVGTSVAAIMIFFLFLGSDGNASKAKNVADEYRKLPAVMTGPAPAQETCRR